MACYSIYQFQCRAGVKGAEVQNAATGSDRTGDTLASGLDPDITLAAAENVGVKAWQG